MANGLSERLFQAWYLYQARSGGSRSQIWLADAVSRELKLAQGAYFTQASVSRWMKGTEPNLETIQALGKVLGVNPGWLAFGELAAPGPADPVHAGMRRLNRVED